MGIFRPCGACLTILMLSLQFGFCASAGNGTLNWNTNENRVSADIQSEKLLDFLERLAVLNRWHVLVEPGLTHTVSAKFKDLNTGQALRSLLGDLNFALVPQTNGPARLYVFRTERRNATILVTFSKDPAPSAQSRVIPNELIV